MAYTAINLIVPTKALRADSWCESYYFAWHLDATISQVISLELLPEFQDFSIREYYKV